ncbi:DUF4238 domain-containing protein [Pseudomonas viridiflava]|uniref:DUF4238 domain-containing protein n=1 Tax=Pseudomonas viridiflava TaxID=33069 RepID=UPI000F03C420|nr:DUF4238 domain-containing protein [Pseudomonas viridiflava]
MTELSLTKSQHYVPRIYQKGWAPGRWQIPGYPKECVIWVHDLLNKKAFPTGPNAMLTSSWFYEADKTAPDNELEQWFGSFESAYAKTIRFIDQILVKITELLPVEHLGAHWGAALSSIAQRSPEFLIILKEFAAVCYARTPELMALKHGELKADFRVGADQAQVLTKPYTFVSHFRESTLIQRFLSLNMQVWIAPEGGLLTSDRPCYDFRDVASGTWPLAGYDIGRQNDVAAFMPLSPQLAILLAPSKMKAMGRQIVYPPFSTKVLSKGEVDSANGMTINMAGRWLIGSERFDNIYEKREMPLRGS